MLGVIVKVSLHNLCVIKASSALSASSRRRSKSNIFVWRLETIYYSHLLQFFSNLFVKMYVLRVSIFRYQVGWVALGVCRTGRKVVKGRWVVPSVKQASSRSYLAPMDLFGAVIARRDSFSITRSSVGQLNTLRWETQSISKWLSTKKVANLSLSLWRSSAVIPPSAWDTSSYRVSNLYISTLSR